MFHSSNSTGRRSLITLIVILIIAGAGFGAYLSARSTDRSIRLQLGNRASTIAQLLNKKEVSQLTGTAMDINEPYYEDLKQTLTDLKVANDDVRSMYVTVSRNDKLYFYVDSEKPGSNYYSEPGEYYPDATPLFKSIFISGKPAVEGPSKDDFGTWVSGLAPIRAAGDNQILAVLGIDIDASYYYSAVAQAAAVPVLLGLLALGLVVIYERMRLNYQRQLRVRSELVSIASHELRSPLSGIRWAAENLTNHLNGDDRVTAHQIVNSSTSLQTSIEDILELSHVNSGKNRGLVLADCDMTDLISQVCDTQQLVAEQKSVRLVMTDKWQPAVMMRCDGDVMKRALHDIISNAIKYTRKGSDVVIDYAATSNAHQITISDHGIGIPKAEQSKVFGGFYRASNAKGIQGTGLGLYLTRSVMEQHHGSVSFVSQQDKGTTFTLSLPR